MLVFQKLINYFFILIHYFQKLINYFFILIHYFFIKDFVSKCNIFEKTPS